ncbi:MAG: glycoside hydrolase family 32 protein [Fermentimonas sp.]|nr:glycoside hydrolase family 32 protein [Fermentimonas sp.]
MNYVKIKFTLISISLLTIFSLYAGEIEIKISKNYLNIPITHNVDRAKMTFKLNGEPDLSVVVRLAPDEPEYWVFKDVSHLKGKTLVVSYDGNSIGLKKMYQDDSIAGNDSLYKENNRPQFHFTTRRGWINDPNGLIYYEGEYHLFYQHNPYERDWENMHWGHAISKDLIHWEELTDAMYPDQLGTMFSGSAVIDFDNTAGFKKGGEPAMIAIYTAAVSDKQVQAVAYSHDKGRTFTKFEGNPVIDSKHIWNSQDTRDPKVFWYTPANHWVMVLNERDGHSIYTSSNLKEWNYESHITGFWECPELFELPVDGDTNNTLWVMYGASGTYMLGSFDGKVFTPQKGKYLYTTGSMYAAQTFSNLPENRRVQIGWGRISHPGMPFNGMMMLPTELTLRTTKDGVRLFSYPIEEVNKLADKSKKWSNLNVEEASRVINEFSNESLLRIRLTMILSHATGAGMNYRGQNILNYDMNSNTVNGVFYSPEDMTSMEISADIFIDKTSVEIFIDNGAYSTTFERRSINPVEGFNFWGNNILIKELQISTLKSIWD